MTGAEDLSKNKLKFAFLKYSESDSKSLDFTRPVKLADGDRYQLFIESDTATCLYLVYVNSSDVASIMLRSSLKPGVPVFIPSEKRPFIIHPPAGKDKIYMIVSSSPLEKLEKLLDNLRNNKDAVNENSQAVVDEIIRLKREGSELGEIANKPVSIGGTSRGPKLPDYRIIHWKNIYVTTIRLNH